MVSAGFWVLVFNNKVRVGSSCGVVSVEYIAEFWNRNIKEKRGRMPR